MQISVASGKGGTGKTTVATNLAALAALEGRQVHLLDCDVEEPNCHLFLDHQLSRQETVTVAVPHVDLMRCDGCGKCGEICQFNALACLATGVLVFPELCHGCGGCWLVCPSGAITQEAREIGSLEEGVAHGFRFTQGRLRIGEAQATPLIHRVRATADGNALVIADSPPGTSCPAIAAMQGSDFVLLVTEPTPFGLNDLTLAVATVRHLGLRCGVVVNRAGCGDDRVHAYCRREGIPVLLDLPDDRQVARAYSVGRLAIDAVPETRQLFDQLLDDITSQCIGGAA